LYYSSRPSGDNPGLTYRRHQHFGFMALLDHEETS
jgi:hypothetical protein